MAQTTNEKQISASCIMCMSSFGITSDSIPRECINEKCKQNFCTKCVKQIQMYNGNKRPFKCMYCLHEYAPNTIPAENGPLKKELWQQTIHKHDIERTRHLLSPQSNVEELKFDIQCRQLHLSYLVSTYTRFHNRPQVQEIYKEAERIINKLAQIGQELKQNPNNNIVLCKNRYKESISNPNDNDDVGSRYVNLCERLLFENSNAEFSSIFPRTTAETNDWLHEQGPTDEFQPKILPLIKAIEEDIINQWANPRFTVRAKIGVIGYSNVGKSSLLNRLLGIGNLNDNNAAPVRTVRSTYYQLQFDRQKPLIDPNHQGIEIPVTLVDIQGLEKDRPIVNDHIIAGNYLDEIRKADCDIYILVVDEKLRFEQHGWIEYIQHELNRKCVIARSKMDYYYLNKFREISGKPFGRSTPQQRNQHEQDIINQIRHESAVDLELGRVFLTAANYTPESIDAAILLDTHSFDLAALLEHLSSLSFDARTCRIRSLATREMSRVINTCFRRAYVLNVLKYKIGSGIAAIIPFGEELPRYLSEKDIEKAFGINDVFRQYLTLFNLLIEEGSLKTSVFQKIFGNNERSNRSTLTASSLGKAAGYTLAAGGAVSDDIIRIVSPSVTTISTTGRVVVGVTTVLVGVILSAGICAWSAVKNGKHIFSYVNLICDDLIVVACEVIASIIDREQERILQEHF